MAPDGCCDGNQTGDTAEEVMAQKVNSIENFKPSEETASLLAEGIALLANSIDYSGSVKGKIGLGGGFKVLGVDVKAEANFVSVTGEVVPRADKTNFTGKIAAPELKASLSIGPKNSDKSINVSALLFP